MGRLRVATSRARSDASASDSPALANRSAGGGRHGRLGRGAVKGLSGVVWLFIAYMLCETYNPIVTADT